MQRVILDEKGEMAKGSEFQHPRDDVRVARYLLRVARYLSRVAICFRQILQRVILDGKGENALGSDF